MSETKKNKVLMAAQSVFLRYGYKRVNMNDIAVAASISRAALYVLFKNKEEIFSGVILQWVDEAIAEIQVETAKAATPQEKIKLAFEIWSVRPFQMMMNSPEAKEILDCSFEFAQAALKQGYERFETAIVPILALLAERPPAKAQISPERAAHVLASAVGGFKQTAASADEMRQLIHELLLLSFNVQLSDSKVFKTLRTPLVKSDKPRR